MSEVNGPDVGDVIIGRVTDSKPVTGTRKNPRYMGSIIVTRQ